MKNNYTTLRTTTLLYTITRDNIRWQLLLSLLLVFNRPGRPRVVGGRMISDLYARAAKYFPRFHLSPPAKSTAAQQLRIS